MRALVIFLVLNTLSFASAFILSGLLPSHKSIVLAGRSNGFAYHTRTRLSSPSSFRPAQPKTKICTVAASTPSINDRDGKRVVIVGAGPAGLAQQGWLLPISFSKETKGVLVSDAQASKQLAVSRSKAGARRKIELRFA